jgi:hypothetical protein
MKLTIFGPNLSPKHQATGDFHVHALGCRDCRNYKGDEVENFEATTIREIVEDIYSDHIAESENQDWEEYNVGFHIFPCAKGLKGE